MTTSYNGVDSFPTSITLPADGEPPVVASVNVPFEGLADRTMFLYNHAYLANDGRAYRNFHTPTFKDTAGSNYDFSSARADGSSSAPAFWSTTYNLWIKPGSPTAGSFYIGDNGFFSKYATGATSPPTLQIGCDSTVGINPGRVALFHTASVAADPAYILGPASGDFNGTWTTKVLDANAYASFVRPNDCGVTPAQTMLVVGGGDISGFGQLLIWRSVDFGNSFARIVVDNAPQFGQYFSRIVVGGSRAIVWQKAAAINGGAKIYYSDNDGATWSSRSGLPFDNIVDGAYLSDLGMWAFTSGTSIWTATDPVAGSFTESPLGIAVSAIGGVRHALLYAQQISGIRPEVRLSLDGMNSVQFVYREITTGGASIKSISASPNGQMLVQTIDALALTHRE